MNELLQVENLSVRYPGRLTLLGRRPGPLAVKDVSFAVERGRTYGLVGESGSGKTTVGRALLRLLPPAGGRVVFDGHDVTAFGRHTPRSYRRSTQVVFQDTTSSLNPVRTVAHHLDEPLALHYGMGRAERQKRLLELLDQVGLSATSAACYPRELSGGQRQRVLIARALAVQPQMVVCDEPTSALDVSTQSQVINLLRQCQRDLSVSYVFISHDLAVVRHISHDIGVLFAGRLVEHGPVERVFAAPAHPYTRALLDAVPVPDPRVQSRRRQANIDPPKPSEAVDAQVTGCPYSNRCPLVVDICRESMPAARPVVGGGEVACHRYDGDGSGSPNRGDGSLAAAGQEANQ